MSIKDTILAADDVQTETVEVPEWGLTLHVRGMTGSERDQFEQSLMVERGGRRVMDTANIRAKAVVRCLVDDDGRRVFADGDANELGSKSAAVLERIYDVAARLSGLRDEDVAAREQDFTTTGSPSSSTSPNGSASLSPAS